MNASCLLHVISSLCTYEYLYEQISQFTVVYFTSVVFLIVARKLASKHGLPPAPPGPLYGHDRLYRILNVCQWCLLLGSLQDPFSSIRRSLGPVRMGVCLGALLLSLPHSPRSAPGSCQFPRSVDNIFEIGIAFLMIEDAARGAHIYLDRDRTVKQTLTAPS